MVEISLCLLVQTIPQKFVLIFEVLQ